MSSSLDTNENSPDRGKKDRQRQPRRKRGDVLQFPWKLHALLEGAEKSGQDHIISWLPDGRSFQIHDKEAFEEGLMPMFFSTSKFKSFQRSLNLWGFESTPNVGYKNGFRFNKFFIKGKPDLCHFMTRTKVKGKGENYSPCPSGSPSALESQADSSRNHQYLFSSRGGEEAPRRTGPNPASNTTVVPSALATGAYHADLRTASTGINTNNGERSWYTAVLNDDPRLFLRGCHDGDSSGAGRSATVTTFQTPAPARLVDITGGADSRMNANSDTTANSRLLRMSQLHLEQRLLNDIAAVRFDYSRRREHHLVAATSSTSANTLTTAIPSTSNAASHRGDGDDWKRILSTRGIIAQRTCLQHIGAANFDFGGSISSCCDGNHQCR
eukprot:CAMPEP_0117057656 /NCGR_PEP_ID=MMETSP0472-20121206/40049_1 /TAXON_ID=693140 ORGANISM="Tiarina fusus, Strain LIS" /NCGR_SAMPLE_ID=MMETSP0472 /ASSEMBLY_ACC=CAM_ASM_000603 /LENGTH=382 /DNA_ID=CAMNT_0004774669 /DNA_START=40 /DNA_END=1185 /DNA_ORIENTATION=-